MGERVITESLLRQRFLKEIPATFPVRRDQILTPAARQYLRERQVEIVVCDTPTHDGSTAAGASQKGYVSVAEGRFYAVKPEHLTHLVGNRLLPKDHPRIVFRGKLDGFQADILLLQQQALARGQVTLGRDLGAILARARSIMRADVLGESLSGWTFDGLDEDAIRQRTHAPEQFFAGGHLQLSADMDADLLALNRLRTQVRSVEIAAVSAFAADSGAERPDIVQALNRLSSVLYLMMLRAAQSAGKSNKSMETNLVDQAVARVLAELGREKPGIPVELSARHVHLSPDDVQKLFGRPLTPARDLSQPGQYLCQERIHLVGPGGRLENVAVLGPSRGQTQIEVSLADTRVLGLDAPVRQSGDTAGSAGVQIVSERDTVSVEEGLLVAGRHIHMTPADAERFGLKDQDLARVRVGDERAVVFEKVLVRVNDNYRLAMHLDFDEGNACAWRAGMQGFLLKDPESR